MEKFEEENKNLKEALVKLAAEKMAIDQVCLNNIQENIRLRTEIILLQQKLQEKMKEPLVPESVALEE